MDKVIFQMSMPCPEGSIGVEQTQADPEHLRVTTVLQGPLSTVVAGPVRMTKKQASMLADMLRLWSTGKVS